MFARARNLFALASILIVVGCAGPGRKVTPLARTENKPAPSAELMERALQVLREPEEPIVLTPERTATPTPTPIPVPTPTPSTPAPRAAPVIPVTGWISLRDWCAEKGLPPPVVKMTATETNVEIRAESGVFVFDPPRRNARWNGISVGVGFPLQFIDRQPYVHALDVAKVLEPLMMPRLAPARKHGGILVLDAGHGGSNEGARSATGGKEKEFTLDWARRVERLLAGSPWKVVMTRHGDVDVALTNRVAFATEQRADLFVSLHFNSFSRRDEAGLETYCFTPQGMSSHLTRDYPDPVDMAFGNNQFDGENLLLAYDMHRAMLKHTNRKDRGVRRARFMTVLREQRCPAVLLEGGYLSNPEEARLIATPAYRQKLAEAVVEALGVTPAALTSSRP